MTEPCQSGGGERLAHIRSVRVLSGQQLSQASPVSYLGFGGPDRAKVA